MRDNRCPRCGQVRGPEQVSLRKKNGPQLSQPPIQFDVVTSSKPPRSLPDADWRQELKRKLDQHIEKKLDDTEAAEEKVLSIVPEPETEVERESLFKYRLKKARTQAPGPDASVALNRKTAVVFEKPLVHETRTRPIAPRRKPSGQKDLALQPAETLATEGEKDDQVVGAAGDRPISREILFSRLLAAIIDLFFPVLLAFGFTFAAAWLLELEFFSATSLGWIALFSAGFYFFNSIFFLSTSGQTPGMFVTELRLVDQKEGETPSQATILLWVVLFLPSAISLIGLGWAVFDPKCRCVHDLLSGTRVESTK